MSDQFDFDPGSAENQQDFQFRGVPAGRYVVGLASATEGSTSNGLGTRFELTFAVLDGEHKGAQIKTYPVIAHQKQAAVQLGRRQIGAICRACGRLTAKSMHDLMGIPIYIDVEVDGQFNRITAYHSYTGSAPPPPAPRQTIGDDEIPF